MRRRLKRPIKWKRVLLTTLVFIIIIGLVLLSYIFLSDVKRGYQKEISKLTEQIKAREVEVYEANDVIQAGKRITPDMLSKVKAYSNQSKNLFFTQSDIGNIALVDIQKGTQLLKSMTRKESLDKSLREVEYNVLLLSNNMKDNDEVDIRIRYPNGEDYVVLSKISIHKINNETGNLYFWLEPEQILNMSAAIVDCYLCNGSILYSTKYISPTIQEGSIVTYVPNESVITLIKKDPNVVQTALNELSTQNRMSLEERLDNFYQTYDERINWEEMNKYYKNTNSLNSQNTKTAVESDENTSSDDGTVNANEYSELDKDNMAEEKEESEIYYVD